MIPVAPAPEPPIFHDRVRVPGAQALLDDKDPLPNYWGRCQKELWEAYDGICAYSCFFIHPTTGATSVEHFAPKSAHRDDAYEWSNYRLVSARLNSRKNKYEDVLDPFHVADEWFALDLLAFTIKVGPKAPDGKDVEINDTIKRLKLNSRELRLDREIYFKWWFKREVEDTFMKRCAPFLFFEIERQNIPRP